MSDLKVSISLTKKQLRHIYGLMQDANNYLGAQEMPKKTQEIIKKALEKLESKEKR